MNKRKIGTIVRAVLMVLSILLLLMFAAPIVFGKPFNELTAKDVEQVLGVCFIAITYIWSHWKNNSYTAGAQSADEYLDSLSDGEDHGGGITPLSGKTNLGLVEYAKAQVGHPYWYGNFGWIATRKLYEAKKAQYPKYYTWALPASQLGKRVYDCVGLIKGFLWSASITAVPKFNKDQDVSANGMLLMCKKYSKSGKIATLPEVPGTLVFKDGHVGVYIGGGKVVEAKGHAWGVIVSNLKNTAWTDWGWCPWIHYETEQKSIPEKKTEPAKGKATTSYYSKYIGNSIYIDKVLSAINVPAKYIGSWKARKPLANANGIKLYVGSSSQNIKLINLAKQGKLKRP